MTEAVDVVAFGDGQALAEPRLWLLGYGGWTGTASATLVGIAGAARTALVGVTSTFAAFVPSGVADASSS